MPEFVSINKFKNLTDSKLSREVLKELCMKGVIPHITTEKGYILINLDDAPEDLEFLSAMADLESAEDFLDFFGVAYDPAVVEVNRLHILQRFHQYLGQYPATRLYNTPDRIWCSARPPPPA